MPDGEPDFTAPYRMYMPDGELIEVVPTYAEQDIAARQYDDYIAFYDDDGWAKRGYMRPDLLPDDDDPPF